jgi:hypothetical protein
MHSDNARIWPMKWPVFMVDRHQGDTAYGWPFCYGYSQNDVVSHRLFNISGSENTLNLVLSWVFWGLIVWCSVLGSFYWSSRLRRKSPNQPLQLPDAARVRNGTFGL